MRRKGSLLGAALAFALVAYANSAAWSTSNPPPTSPSVTTSTNGNGIKWGNFNDGVQYDIIDPSGSNSASSNNWVVLKTSNQFETFTNANAPAYQSVFNDNGLVGVTITTSSGNTTLNALNVSTLSGSTLNPANSSANQSRVYYDPDGPSSSNCSNTGGRWLFVSRAQETVGGSTIDGLLIASTTQSDASNGPGNVSNWNSQAFIPGSCAQASNCMADPVLGWNSHYIAIAVDNYTSNEPALVWLNHDQFECGGGSYPSLQGVLTTSQFSVADGNNAVLAGACPAPGYRNTTLYGSGSTKGFVDNDLYVIADYNGSASQIVVSTLQYSTGNPSGSFVAGSAITPSQAWYTPPASVTQSGQTGSSPAVSFAPGDMRFTSCMFRSGAVWGAQNVGVSGSSNSMVAQWFEIGEESPLTASKVYVQGQFGAGASDVGCSTTSGCLYPPASDNAFNPSIAANTHCPTRTTGPTCDVLVGYTDIPTSGSSSFMSSAYLFNPANSVQEDVPNGYTDGAGTDGYEGCTTASGGGSGSPIGIVAGPFTATSINTKSTRTGGGTYPTDLDFVSAANAASQAIGCDTNGKEWYASFAEVPN
jgi:hypothetical protein